MTKKPSRSARLKPRKTRETRAIEKVFAEHGQTVEVITIKGRPGGRFFIVSWDGYKLPRWESLGWSVEEARRQVRWLEARPVEPPAPSPFDVEPSYVRCRHCVGRFLDIDAIYTRCMAPDRRDRRCESKGE